MSSDRRMHSITIGYAYILPLGGKKKAGSMADQVKITLNKS